MAQTPNGSTSKPTPPAAPKAEGKRFNLKLKMPDGKWKTFGTAFLRENGSGGAMTLYKEVKELFAEGVEKVDQIAIFLNDGKYAKARG